MLRRRPQQPPHTAPPTARRPGRRHARTPARRRCRTAAPPYRRAAAAEPATLARVRAQVLGSVGAWGAGAGQLKFPSGLALDAARGALYVTDRLNHRVVAYDAALRAPLLSFGRRGQAEGALSHPEGIALHDGALFVADAGNARVSAFRRDGTFLRSFGGEGESAGRFLMPQGVISAHGRLYVSDHSGRRLQTFTARGEPLQHVNFVRREAPDQMLLGRLEGLCVSRAEDKLYVVDLDAHKLHVLLVRNNTHAPRYIRVVPGAPATELGYVEVAGGRANIVAGGFPVPDEEVKPQKAVRPAKAAGGKRAGGKAAARRRAAAPRPPCWRSARRSRRRASAPSPRWRRTARRRRARRRRRGGTRRRGRGRRSARRRARRRWPSARRSASGRAAAPQERRVSSNMHTRGRGVRRER